MVLILQERSRRLSSFSLRGEDNQPDFHSEEFERSLEAGIKRILHQQLNFTSNLIFWVEMG